MHCVLQLKGSMDGEADAQINLAQNRKVADPKG